ncbi:MAG: DNA-directed RNA polymerase subunit alpha C-terminal domain-containing protein [Planctomycetota bacterium]
METTLDLATIFQQETFDDGAYDALKQLAFSNTESINRLKELMAGIAGDDGGDAAGRNMKLGMSHLLLDNASEAAAWLEKAPPCAQRSYYLGMAYRQMRRYTDALAEFENARREGWNGIVCRCHEAECLLLAGQPDRAREIIEQTASEGKEQADWHYVRGRISQEDGDVEQAIEHYEKALDFDEDHPWGMFHLAYLLDLHGSDERAMDLYLICSELPVVYADALINLAVNHEDRCEYEKAAQCLRRVLKVNPNNRRARLYLKDVLAACEMFIDEQQIKEEETRNAVLDIPVTDFELSVRSRNCLKKMNILTLGDLLKTTEVELLSYKNFGETSLKEIKVMLTQKGLSLGQYSDEDDAASPLGQAPVPSQGDLEVLSKPASMLKLSVRSRKCLQRLRINTIGEITAKTEAELLGSRNFGQTSLSEIKSCLADLGLSLKGSE